jgi:hypothetical protein
VVTGAPRALIEAVWLAIWEIEHISCKGRSHGMPPRTPTSRAGPPGRATQAKRANHVARRREPRFGSL